MHPGLLPSGGARIRGRPESRPRHETGAVASGSHEHRVRSECACLHFPPWAPHPALQSQLCCLATCLRALQGQPGSRLCLFSLSPLPPSRGAVHSGVLGAPWPKETVEGWVSDSILPHRTAHLATGMMPTAMLSRPGLARARSHSPCLAQDKPLCECFLESAERLTVG